MMRPLRSGAKANAAGSALRPPLPSLNSVHAPVASAYPSVRGNDLTRQFPLIADAMARLRSRSCIIDGEAVGRRKEPKSRQGNIIAD
jgi:hypothetical protein